MRIALFPNYSRENTAPISKQVRALLETYGAEVIEVPLSQDAASVIASADLSIAIGGDGTAIRCARLSSPFGKPTLGINAGRVGYICELESGEIDRLSGLFSGAYLVEKRMMLLASVSRGGTVLREFSALNDIVLSRGTLSRMIDFEVSAAGGAPCRYRADGLIFATPTGSTAYSYSAGGPVVDPELSCILLTPVCAHTPTGARSLVFSAGETLYLKAPQESETQLYLTADGAENFAMEPGDVLTIVKNDTTADFIRLKNRNFYTLFNEKLMKG